MNLLQETLKVMYNQSLESAVIYLMDHYDHDDFPIVAEKLMEKSDYFQICLKNNRLSEVNYRLTSE